MAINSTWLQSRATATQLQIEAYEAAILALGVDNTQSYDLDTGQSRQKVTRLDLNNLNKTLDSLYNRYSIICARLNRSGTIISKPGW